MQRNLNRMPCIALFATIILGLGLVFSCGPAAADVPAAAAPSATVNSGPNNTGSSQPAIAANVGQSPQTTQSTVVVAPPVPLPHQLTYVILIGMTLVWVVCLTACLRTLGTQNWSLAQALSEEAKLPTGSPAPAQGALPPMVASASRLSAMVGVIVLGSFFVALGYYVIWQLCNGQSIEPANGAWTYFLGGLSLFAPYAVNKATSIFP